MEDDFTVGPKSFVNIWHNNGKELVESESPRKYSDDYKIDICGQCVKFNLGVKDASKRFDVPERTLHTWFQDLNIVQERKKFLRERVENLKQMGYENGYIANELGISVRSVYNYSR